MFSTALAKASAAVPKSHPALDRLTATSRRARASRARWKGDGAVDIGCIVRAAGFFDVATNRVELGAQCRYVGLGSNGRSTVLEPEL